MARGNDSNRNIVDLNLASDRNSKKIDFYINVVSTGVTRGGISLLIEHPLESVKTQWQDQSEKVRNNTKSSSCRDILRSIYKEKGMNGFYRGFIPNLVRVSFKQVYRWPLMVFFPNFYEKKLPKVLKEKYKAIPKLLTGLTIANLEIFVITPLDRLKIYFMTSKFKEGVTAGGSSNFTTINTNSTLPRSKFLFFIRSLQHGFITEFFRGLEATFWRSNASWVSFLYLEYKFKAFAKVFLGKENLGLIELFIVSIFVGVGNLLISK